MCLMLSLVMQMHCETSGKEALKWIEQNKVFPDLILLDCMMPGMSGTCKAASPLDFGVSGPMQLCLSSG